MRRLLTTGIKAILAVAALTTAAHWTLRLQRDADPAPTALAAIPEPTTTGSIAPRAVERATPAALGESPAPKPTQSLDQLHLSKLFANAATEKPKPATKPVAKR